MNRGITTSVRLPPKLRDQLEDAAHVLHRGKNWVIVHALQEYLTKLEQHKLTEEARRQSLLASSNEHSENQPWDEDTDTSGWK
jgi:predicted DNA-binding protein